MDIFDENESLDGLVRSYLLYSETSSSKLSRRINFTDEDVKYAIQLIKERPHLSTFYTLRSKVLERRTDIIKRTSLKDAKYLIRNIYTDKILGPLTMPELIYKTNGAYTTIMSALTRKSILYKKWIVIEEGDEFYIPKNLHIYEITDTETGEIKSFFNLEEASDFLCTSKSYVCQAIALGRKIKNFTIKKKKP